MTTARVSPVAVAHLAPNPFQPRFTIDDADLDSLVASIREYGFVGHVEVRRDPADPTRPLQIVFGHRRIEAAKRAGLATVPAAIVDRSDDQMRRLSFVENAARKDLTYWEEAVFVADMKQELSLSVREVAAALGKSRGWVQERLDIASLPEGPLRDAAQRDEISFSAAWLLLQMDASERDRLFAAVKSGTLNVSDLRAIRRAHQSRSATMQATDGPGPSAHPRVVEPPNRIAAMASSPPPGPAYPSAVPLHAAADGDARRPRQTSGRII